MGVIVAHGSQAVVLRVGTFHFSHISIRASLVDPFMLYFRLPMEASLVDIIQGVFLLVFLIVVDILGQSDLLVFVQRQGLNLVVGPLDISRKNALVIER